MAGKEEIMQISKPQWMQIQDQLLQTKQEKYELDADVQKKRKEITNLREVLSKREEELKALKESHAEEDTKGSKTEKKILQKTIQQMQEENASQQNALRENLTSISKECDALQTRFNSEQKAHTESKRMVRTLQVQLKTSRTQEEEQIKKNVQILDSNKETQQKINSLEEQLKTVTAQRAEQQKILDHVKTEKEILLQKNRQKKIKKIRKFP